MKGLLALVIMIVFGALLALLYVKVLKKSVVGKLAGGILVAALGSVIGGFLLNGVITRLDFLIRNSLNVNFVAAFLGAMAFLWILHLMTLKNS